MHLKHTYTKAFLMKKIILITALLLGLSTSVLAETWGNTNVQFLYGQDFDNLVGGDGVKDGDMQTITIEHVGGWEYGQNFFFFDLTSADFTSGKKHKLYGEWAPKVSLSKTMGADYSWWIIKDVNLAGEINQGDNFRATNIGIGLDLDIPSFKFFDLNIFNRKDNFNDATFQITMAWNSSFSILSAPLVFEGFFDYYGNDYGTEIVTQPRLLLEGKVFGKSTETLQAGVELYYYKSSKSPFHERLNEAVPQLILKWIW